MSEKPEHMTHLRGDTLVPKSHPIIFLRGKLDSLGAQIVLIQCDLADMGADPALLADLQEILEILGEIMRAEVKEDALARDSVLGLTWAEIRAQSHAPQKYFGVRALTPPDRSLGRTYALLNALRAAIRETELAAVKAFDTKRPDLTLALNRLSSAVYILMCRTVKEECRGVEE